MKRLLCCAVAIMALAGCARTEPVKNVKETVSAKYSGEQIKKAVTEAGLARQWVMQPAGPGVINGHLMQRGHRADIRVTYGTGQYAIDYVSSQNLLAENGQIHRNYNRWIANLDQDIQLRLASQGVN
ncbi:MULTISPECIES: lipoprotein [Erwinia]|uniref:lipoprotein n=1 Tax=Erwinia TaxID=551 RepID=UPI000554610F|nr:MULTISPECIES: lipoprotein [Erwinia]